MPNFDEQFKSDLRALALVGIIVSLLCYKKCYSSEESVKQKNQPCKTEKSR